MSAIDKVEKDRQSIINAYSNLVRDCMDFTSKEERKLIRKAFDFGNELHKNIRRKSGEPYILHPIAVARITVREIGLQDATSIIAALLHDVIEDTETELAEIDALFGSTVARIVDGLTKISAVVDPSASMQAESFRKMLLTMSDDVRVALIKIADRLHNMRTLSHMKPAKQLKIASETSYLYAPLAHRLGLYNIKSELEDLSLKYTEPDAYNDISKKLKATKEQRDKYISQFIKPLKQKMSELGLKCTINGRVKSISSIYEKMKRQGVTFDDVYDIFAVRIVIDSPPETEKADCRRAYDAVASSFRAHSNRMRDWISDPKASGYEAIHTTVTGPRGRWVEVQIRSVRMDFAAEKGMAAHWRYKDKSENTSNEIFEEWVLKIRELLESKKLGGADLIKEVKSELVAEQIYIFTPKGELKTMQAGSTVLDFAYEIHSKVGMHCIGAKVNYYRTEPLSYVLQQGDQVEILTSVKQEPVPEWLTFIKTTKAANKVNEFLKAKKQTLIKKGKEVFERKIQRIGITVEHQGITEFLKEFKIPDLQELYYRLGAHRLDIKRVQEFIQQNINRQFEALKENEEPKPVVEKPTITHSDEINYDNLLIGSEVQDSHFRLAACCKPIHGDDILAFSNAEGNGFLVHRKNCPNVTMLLSSESHKMVNAKWSEQKDLLEFLAGVKIMGHDKKRMLNEIVKVISIEMNVNIRSITIGSTDGIFEGDVKLYVRDVDELNMMINKLLKINGVTQVIRTNS